MAPENGQSENLKQVSAAQGRLEGLAKDKDASKEIVSKITSKEYVNVYKTNLDQGKNSLISASASFKTTEAKDYLNAGAAKLSTNMGNLAQEGFRLKQLTSAEELKPLDTLKDNLSKELDAQKSAIGEFRSIEALSTELDALKSRNDAINKGSSFATLTSNLLRKEEFKKANSKSWDKLIALNIKDDSVSSALNKSLYKKYSEFDDTLKSEAEEGAKFEAARSILKKQSGDLAPLETQISGKPKPMSEKDYQEISDKIKLTANATYACYTDNDMAAYKTNNSVFADPLGKNFSSQFYEPIMIRLDKAVLDLEAKRPPTKKLETDTDLLNDTAVAQAKTEFRAEAKLLADLDKKIDEAYKIKSKKPGDAKADKDANILSNDSKVLAEMGALIKARELAHENIIKNNGLGELDKWKVSPQKDLAIVVNNEYREPNKALLNSLQARQAAHEKEIAAYENKLLNDKLAEMLPEMDKTWQANVNEQALVFDKAARTVKQAPTFDEKTPEFKDYQKAELTLLRFLVNAESQVSIFLSKKDVIDNTGNNSTLSRLLEYQKLCSSYLGQIGNNRTQRNLEKASTALEEKTAAFKVPVIKYINPDGSSKTIDEHNETFKYKFSEYIVFINPNDPKFKEINNGVGWDYKPGKEALLPGPVKLLLSQQAASIIAADQNSGMKEMERGKRSILLKKLSPENAEKDLKPEGQPYFDAIRATQAGNPGEAIKKYQEYLKASAYFDKEVAEKHAPYIAEATAQIETLGLSTAYFEAVALLKTNKTEGIKALSKFITDNQSKLPKEKIKVQEYLNASIEIVQQYNLSKYKAMDELRDDLLKLTIREIQEGAGTSTAKDKNSFEGDPTKSKSKAWRLEFAEQGLQGPEVKKMNEFFTALKTKIDAGEPVDFDATFKDFAARQNEFLRSVDPKINLHPADFAKDKDGKYPAKYPDGHSFTDSPSNRLIVLFNKVNKETVKDREAGYVEVAEFFYGKDTGMATTQKYLDKAMTSTYEDYLKTPTGKTLLKSKLSEMRNDVDLAKATDEGAKAMYKQHLKDAGIIEEPPKFSGPIFESFKASIFQKRVQDEVKRQIRKTLSDLASDHLNDPDPADVLAKRKGNVRAFMDEKIYQKYLEAESKKPFTSLEAKEAFFKKEGISPDTFRMLYKGGNLEPLPPAKPKRFELSPALALYKKSLPYNTDTAHWAKPWTWDDYNEDQWNEFKVDAAELALQTLVTLPIGMAAGAVGKLATRAALSLAARGGAAAGVSAGTTALSEAAFVAFERGGIRALLAEQSLSAISRTRLIAAWGAGLAAEGGTMFVLNSAWEGMSTGHVSWAEGDDAGFWKFASHLTESIGKAALFRGIGQAQGKTISKLTAAGGGAGSKLLAVAAGEVVSGFGGASLEALEMMAHGKGKEITMDFWIKSMAQNALMSVGTHYAHKATTTEHPISTKEKAKYDKVEVELNTKRLAEYGIEKPANIADVKALPNGDLIVNGMPFDIKKINIELLPKPIRDVLLPKIKEAKLITGKAEIKSKLELAKATDPSDIESVKDGKMITKSGVEIPITSADHLPDNFKPRVKELQHEEVKQKAKASNKIHDLFLEKAQHEKALKSDPENQALKDQLAAVEAKLDLVAKERKVSVEKLSEQIAIELPLYKTLDSLYAGENAFYKESKVVKKPILDDKGVPKLGPDNLPMYENINLFKNYDTKTSAYSTDLIHSIDHATLVKEGGFKLIKIGGDEIVLYHAGPDNTVQKLFIDISNMGPTNDTAVNMKGSRVNLVDIYLYQISEHIADYSRSRKGKTLEPADFMNGIEKVSTDLFSIDRGPNGEKLSPAEAEAKFKELKSKWGLEGSFADYQSAVGSLNIMAKYRADTRSLDASFKKTKGVSFEEHITTQIEKIAGLPLADIQKLIADHPELFAQAIKDNSPTSEKLIKRSALGEIISKPPTAKELLADIALLKAGKSSPEDLMPLYNMLARLDISKLNTPAFKTLTENLQKNRLELIGEPSHARIEEPRIMDAKIVLIDLPPDVTKALQKMNHAEAQAILNTARALAEQPLDALKYSKTKEFAKFNILDHIEIVKGKIVIRSEAKEFRDAYKENLKDKKVANIEAIEKSLKAIKANLEKIRQDYEQGKMPLDVFKGRIRAAEVEIAKMEDRLSKDPDTGAFTHAFLELKPTRIFNFEDGVIPESNRVWHPVTTELGHAGAINSKYGYTKMDAMMKAYHDVLHAELSKVLPGDLGHFKIIRSGGGKFEIIFLDIRSVEALKKAGHTPESIIFKIAEGPGQKAIATEMNKDPIAKEAVVRDAAVRNSLFKNIKGTEPLVAGKLTVTKEKPISGSEIAAAIGTKPDASGREILGLVHRERSAEKISAKILRETASTNNATIEKLIASGQLKGEAKNTEGYTDIDGTIRLNVDYWNNHIDKKTGKKLLAEGYTFVENPNPGNGKGPLLVVGSDPAKPGQTKQFSFKEYGKQVEGRVGLDVLKSPVYQQFIEFKTHEVHHRVIEVLKDKPVLSVTGSPSVFSKEIIQITKDLAKSLPIDSPLHKQLESTEITFKQAQEIISEIQDGSNKHSEVSAESKAKLTSQLEALFKQVGIDNYSPTNIRTIDTKLLTTSPLEAFKRLDGSDAKTGDNSSPILDAPTPKEVFESTDKSKPTIYEFAYQEYLQTIGDSGNPGIIKTLSPETLARAIIFERYLKQKSAESAPKIEPEKAKADYDKINNPLNWPKSLTEITLSSLEKNYKTFIIEGKFTMALNLFKTYTTKYPDLPFKGYFDHIESKLTNITKLQGDIAMLQETMPKISNLEPNELAHEINELVKKFQKENPTFQLEPNLTLSESPYGKIKTNEKGKIVFETTLDISPTLITKIKFDREFENSEIKANSKYKEKLKKVSVESMLLITKPLPDKVNIEPSERAALIKGENLKYENKIALEIVLKAVDSGKINSTEYARRLLKFFSSNKLNGPIISSIVEFHGSLSMENIRDLVMGEAQGNLLQLLSVGKENLFKTPESITDLKTYLDKLELAKKGVSALGQDVAARLKANDAILASIIKNNPEIHSRLLRLIYEKAGIKIESLPPKVKEIISKSSEEMKKAAYLEVQYTEAKSSFKTSEGARFENLPPQIKEKMRAEAAQIVAEKVQKGRAAIEKKLADIKKEIADSGDYSEIMISKQKHAQNLLKVYESLDFSSPEKVAEILKKMEAVKPPKGFEELPSPAEMFYANFETMPPDFLARILEGKVKYDVVAGPSGSKPTAYIEGRNLGIGGLGEVWSTVVFEGKSRIGKEMVVKKSREILEVENVVKGFESMDTAIQTKLKEIFEEYKSKGINEKGGYEKAKIEADKLIRGSKLNQFDTLLVKYREAQREVKNAKIVMDQQSKGNLKGFTKIEYVSDKGPIFMESIANPKANYAICDYDKIIKGEVTSVDGKTPIVPKSFWGGVADIFEQLGEAHSLGIVHRDIKPENFGIGPDGKIRLIDVGSLRTSENIKDMEFQVMSPEITEAALGIDPNIYLKPGQKEYYMPSEFGVTLGYYQADIGYMHEAKGTLGPDGKPLYAFGYSDRVAMAVVITEIISQQKDPASTLPKWLTPDKIPQMEGLVEYLKEPRGDIIEAAKKLKAIMGISP